MEEYNKAQKDPEYTMKYFPVDDKRSLIPQISVSTSPDGGVEFTSGPAEVSSAIMPEPTAALKNGEVTDAVVLNDTNTKEFERIDAVIDTDSKIYKERSEGTAIMADIGMKLINGLEGTRKGGSAQRWAGTITGSLTSVQDLIGFLTTKTANKPYVDKYYPDFLTNAEIRDDVSGAVIGSWNDMKLTGTSPVWENLKQLGLTLEIFC